MLFVAPGWVFGIKRILAYGRPADGTLFRTELNIVHPDVHGASGVATPGKGPLSGRIDRINRCISSALAARCVYVPRDAISLLTVCESDFRKSRR